MYQKAVKYTNKANCLFPTFPIALTMSLNMEMADILFNIEEETRIDSRFDQFNRVLMKKLHLIVAFLVAANWYNDRINCIIPSDSKLTRFFVADMCWAEGFYIYKEVGFNNTHGYYGIPTDVNHDGRYASSGKLCTRNVKGVIDEQCILMEKKWFCQYQYMHFFFAAFFLIYYFPYELYKVVNSDIVRIHKDLAENEGHRLLVKDAEGDNVILDIPTKKLGHGSVNDIAWYFRNYFDKRDVCWKKGGMRIAGTILIKVLYTAINVSAFLLVNLILNGYYTSFGYNWTKWGKEVLPSPGICEVRRVCVGVAFQEAQVTYSQPSKRKYLSGYHLP